MKTLFLGLLFAACALPAYAKAERVSEDMAKIVKRHLVGKHDLDVKDTPEAKE